MRMVDLPHAKEISEEEGCVKVGRWLRGNDYGPAAPSGFPPKENGWFCNLFYEKNVTYVWRSNERCTKARLLNGLRSVLRRMNEPFPVLVFHENHGGWRALCNPTRFLELESLDELMILLDRHVWNVGKELSSFGQSDNYNMLFGDNGPYMVFSHENELLLFSRELALLESYSSLFRVVKLPVRPQGIS